MATEEASASATAVAVKRVSRPVKPDKTAKDTKVAKLREQIDKYDARVKEIRDILRSKRSSTGQTPEEKQITNDLRNSEGIMRRLRDQRAELNSSLAQLRQVREQQREYDKQLKQRVGQTKVGDIDAQISRLEGQLNSIDAGDSEGERALIEQIQRLYRVRQDLLEVEAKLGAKSDQDEQTERIRNKINQCDQELDEQRKRQDELRRRLQTLREHARVETADIPSLESEKNECVEVIQALKQKIADIRAEWDQANLDFKEQQEKYKEHIAAMREQKQQQWKQNEAEKKARFERHEAELRGAPFDDEILRCDQLLGFLGRYVSDEVDAASSNEASAAVPTSLGPNMIAIKKKGEDDHDPFATLSKKASKNSRKGKKGAAEGAASQQKLQLDVDLLMAFALIKVDVPASVADVSKCKDAVRERKSEFLEKRRKVLAGEALEEEEPEKPETTEEDTQEEAHAADEHEKEDEGVANDADEGANDADEGANDADEDEANDKDDDANNNDDDGANNNDDEEGNKDNEAEVAEGGDAANHVVDDASAEKHDKVEDDAAAASAQDGKEVSVQLDVDTSGPAVRVRLTTSEE